MAFDIAQKVRNFENGERFGKLTLSSADLFRILDTSAYRRGGPAPTSAQQKVKNRGVPPDNFLDQLLAWGKSAEVDIFAPNAAHDIYASVKAVLGPWEGIEHRRAAMLEVMRVLAGFESSWKWNEGVDETSHQVKDADNSEAGAWQVSADSLRLAPELRSLVVARIHTADGVAFQAAMKQDHLLAMECIARLLRVTTAANGPVQRHEIDPWLSRAAVAEFQALLKKGEAPVR